MHAFQIFERGSLRCVQERRASKRLINISVLEHVQNNYVVSKRDVWARVWLM